jgi:hypothetical protein
MKTVIFRLAVLFFLMAPMIGVGQMHKISGTVKAFNQFPVKNVLVKAKKAKTEVRTDENGNFEIDVKNKDVIHINESVFVEYTKKVSEGDQSLQINLIIKNNERDMQNAVKEGFISQEDLDYGIRNLWKWNNEFIQFTDAYDAIKYALPESTIIVENGQKGIQLRGPKTITGSNAALIIVNGVITEDANFITPADIISIRKLSGSELALFGARAGNGVISIQTR